MRTIFIIIICAVNIFFLSKDERRKEEVKLSFLAQIDTVYFKRTIQPIFQQHCNPCHFPGGKMYEKLPFDKAETIVTHESGIMKRIKNEDEMILIRQFIARSRQDSPH
jgi:hypothetical protein